MGGRLPLNVKVLLEGEEEVGSPHLEPFLAAQAARLACDFALSADGGQLSETQPSLSIGLRWAAGSGGGRPDSLSRFSGGFSAACFADAPPACLPRPALQGRAGG